MAKKCIYCKKTFTPRYLTTEKICQDSNCKSKHIENHYLKQKASGTLKNPIKPIAKVSDKRKVLNKDYEKIRIKILSEAKFKCFIEGCTNVANTIEHLMGRRGFADQWARDNDIPLLNDRRYLKPCCLAHNGELETNPELSKKYQFSKISGKPKL